jgi:hypothetical protein
MQTQKEEINKPDYERGAEQLRKRATTLFDARDSRGSRDNCGKHILLLRGKEDFSIMCLSPQYGR